MSFGDELASFALNYKDTHSLSLPRILPKKKKEAESDKPIRASYEYNYDKDCEHDEDYDD